MLLTIITINFNNQKGLESTLASVQNQTFTDFEYVVIDGGSTDGSLEIIRQAEHINYWVSERDKGIYHAMNKGIEKASGSYLLFLNSGDTLHEPQSIEKLIPFIKQAAIYYTKAYCIDNETNKGYVKAYAENISVNYLLEHSINHQNCIIKKRLFNQYGNYDENFKIASFRDFTLRAAKNKEDFVYVPTIIISNYDLKGVSSNYTVAHQEWKQLINLKHPELVETLERSVSKNQQFIYRAIAKLKRIYFSYKLGYFSKQTT